jgi:hypothetical protein
MSVYDYKFHPLAALFPSLSADEFKKLKDDIQAHGQQEPIVLSQDGSVLLDGRHRLRVCKELGIQPRSDRFCATPQITEADFIWSRNVLRRHLTDDQRAAIGNKWADTIREAAKQRMKDGAKGLANPPNPVHTREEVAKKAGVSTHKVRQVETVAKHAPGLLPRVESGDMKLKDAVRTINQPARPSLEQLREEKERLKQQETENQIESHARFQKQKKQHCLSQVHQTFDYLVKFWPKDLDLAPAIKLLRTSADNLEAFQKKRTADQKIKSGKLQKKIQAISVGVGAR